MRGVSVSRLDGKIVLVNVKDDISGAENTCRVDQYIDRGYEPDYRTLPDEDKGGAA